jgi:coenzyme F420-0:L-glutamate ligase/coenzyme F420-1:gamma-L-glutamate ligase
VLYGIVPSIVSTTLRATALPGIPFVGQGDDLVALVDEALGRAGIDLADGDVVVVTSKIVSRAEGRFVSLHDVTPSPRAIEIADRVKKDPRIVEVILRESTAVSRMTRDVLIVRHRLGFVVANAAIDRSNVAPGAPADEVLLLPLDPDASAERVRAGLSARRGGPRIGVVVTDSHGRPFRLGTVGVAIGIAGLPALWDQRGDVDLTGRTLEHTITAFADQIAAVADLVAGQAAEGRPVVHIRGLGWTGAAGRAGDLLRPPHEDLYA